MMSNNEKQSQLESKKQNKVEFIILLIISVVMAFISVFTTFAKSTNQFNLIPQTKTTEKTNVKNYHKDNNGNLISDNILNNNIQTQTINGITLTSLGDNKYQFSGTATETINNINLYNFTTTKNKYYALSIYDLNGNFDNVNRAYFYLYFHRTNASPTYNNATISNNKCAKTLESLSKITLMVMSGTTLNFTCYIQLYENNNAYSYPYLETIYYSQNNYTNYGENQYNNGTIKANEEIASSGLYSLTNAISSITYWDGSHNHGNFYTYEETMQYYKDLYETTDTSSIEYKYYNRNRNNIEIDTYKAIAYILFQQALEDNSYMHLQYGQVNGVWGYYRNTSFGNTASDYTTAIMQEQHIMYISFKFDREYEINNLVCSYTNENNLAFQLNFTDNALHQYTFNTTHTEVYSNLELQNIENPINVNEMKLNISGGNTSFNIADLGENGNIIFSINYNLKGSSYQNGYKQGVENGRILEYQENYHYETYEEIKNNVRQNEYDGLTKEEIYNNGKIQGATEEYSLANEISGIVEMPFQWVKNVLNFEILGLNIFGLFTSAITILLVVFLIKKLTK